MNWCVLRYHEIFFFVRTLRDVCEAFLIQTFSPVDPPVQFLTLRNRFSYHIIKTRGSEINYVEEPLLR